MVVETLCEEQVRLDSDENLQAIARYILYNPVRKGLATSAEEWLWSGHLAEFPYDDL